VASDAVNEVVKRKLIVPTAVRWNSYYDAAVQITDNSSAKLNDVCIKLELRCLVNMSLSF